MPLLLNRLRIDLLQVDESEKQIWKTMNFDEDQDDFISFYTRRRPKHLNTNWRGVEVWCQDGIKTPQGTDAGGHGPPSEYLKDDNDGDFLLSVHDTMCNNHCLVSDYFRAEVIATSQYICLELSTKEHDISYTEEGNFCLKNLGHLLYQRIFEYNQTIYTEIGGFHMCS